MDKNTAQQHEKIWFGLAPVRVPDQSVRVPDQSESVNVPNSEASTSGI